ncbi:immune inhibitor A domain-containing protein [Psychrobium sp. 1_MG-2023]|uniref:immune inhibitor A domain-containing protein n=1 Tax=Psychrobium sp. 1_MG-2023 TaxID=3062624 RepID=UPI000C345C93|nr:immune inhibitor A domain-containing protein [Psychrobium sp. 1_MG-2023]MDP2560805.1 immune inhibitor A [Psychrobium sp. 1_MG-2023]PKF56681.1 protease [Alteromonadales bacterium alter-6D02]
MLKKIVTGVSLALATGSVAAQAELNVVNNDSAIQNLKPEIKTGHTGHIQANGEYKGGSEEVARKLHVGNLLNVARGAESGSGEDSSAPGVATGREWTGPVTTDRILAILIDFPDYPVNAVTPNLTRNYYPDYSVEHYENMLFSEHGYTGPNGQNLISMQQYFADQSGGSYNVVGQVAGWYRAQFNAAHYGAPTANGRKDSRVGDLVLEAITQAAQDPNIDLSYFDQEDRYDYDNDGDFREPDGIIDHIMVYHSSIDQAAGGGALGADAIWSHRSSVGFKEIGDTGYRIHDYTVQPVDGAAGVSAHEYGHDLGLPDEYDTKYSVDGLSTLQPAPGSLVGHWSAMSSGSYAGEISGTAPTGLSPFAKQYLQASLGGNWFVGTNLHADDLSPAGAVYKLDAASVRGNNNDFIRIDLDDKPVQRLAPNDGQGFISSAIPDSNLSIQTIDFALDLTTETAANLTFTADYDTDSNNSLAQVRVIHSSGAYVMRGNITDTNARFSQFIGHGFHGKSDGRVNAEFDLSAFAGEQITVSLQYWAFESGYIGTMFDDIEVTSNNGTLASFDADNANNDGLVINGFEPSNGVFDYPHYYLVEWRQHKGVDAGLARGDFGASYTPGMLVWYVDTSYRPENGGNKNTVTQGDNSVANHPGEGWLGLVDADRNPILFSNGEMANSNLQISDAAFSLDLQKPFSWVSRLGTLSVNDWFINNNPRFIDWDDYSNYLRPATGRKLPSQGIIIEVLEQGADKTVGSIRISKHW